MYCNLYLLMTTFLYELTRRQTLLVSNGKVSHVGLTPYGIIDTMLLVLTWLAKHSEDDCSRLTVLSTGVVPQISFRRDGAYYDVMWGSTFPRVLLYRQDALRDFSSARLTVLFRADTDGHRTALSQKRLHRSETKQHQTKH